MSGKLIVIDGADGAGKATQSRLLAERLMREGHSVRHLESPRYEQNFFGRLLRECLDGAHGDFMALSPKIASVLYAGDRFESSLQLKEWLAEGHTIILDRYVSSNMIHQGSKIEDSEERQKFLEWLDELEHSIFAIPHPHAIVYLDVPFEFRRRLMADDITRTRGDLAERDVEHQQKSEACAGQLALQWDHWHRICCVSDSALRTPEDIHEELFTIVKRLIMP